MLLRKFLPLPARQKEILAFVEHEATSTERKLTRKVLSLPSLGVYTKSFGTILPYDVLFSQLSLAQDKPVLQKDIDTVNLVLERTAFSNARASLAKDPLATISPWIGPTIGCNPAIKELLTLFLFATDRVHILLTADPYTGKEQLLDYVAKMHPNGHQFPPAMKLDQPDPDFFSIRVENDQPTRGVLPLSDDGVCCIQDLHKLSDEERAALASTIDNQYVPYLLQDGRQPRIDVRANILAASSPLGDKFIGKDIVFLRRQVDLSSEFLEKFHVVCMMRMSSLSNLRASVIPPPKECSAQQVASTLTFFQRYIGQAESLLVDFPRVYENVVVDWVTAMKQKNDQLIAPISRSQVVACVRLAQAHARMHLRKEVTENDIKTVLDILQRAFVVPPAPQQ